MTVRRTLGSSRWGVTRMLRESLLAFDLDAVPEHLRWTPDEFGLLAENLRDDPVEYYKEAAAILEALASLTDGEALERLLYQVCCRCDGIGHRAPDAIGGCPSCGGSGRTLKDGVALAVSHGGSYPDPHTGEEREAEPVLHGKDIEGCRTHLPYGEYVLVPLSMLEGGE